jgi:hypothetical protein
MRQALVEIGAPGVTLNHRQADIVAKRAPIGEILQSSQKHHKRVVSRIPFGIPNDC